MVCGPTASREGAGVPRAVGSCTLETPSTIDPPESAVPKPALPDGVAPPDEDLIELKVAWFRLREEGRRINAEAPAGDYMPALDRPALSPQQYERLAQFWARQADVTRQIQGHAWFRALPGGTLAAGEILLADLARARLESAGAAAG